MLELDSVTKIFTKKDQRTKEKTTVGIFDISFSAKPGRIFGLIGANGAGKTTTMRIIADLTSPHSGKVTLDGKSYRDIPHIKRHLGFISGETQVYDRLTPREILTLFGRMAGMGKQEIKDRIDELQEKLAMEDFMDLVTSGFSTGMKQKTSIARALMNKPKVLIFDEVTNGLDIFAARAVKEIIHQLKKEGHIIIYSTHIMPDADELCDDVAIIHKGHVQLQGDVKALLTENVAADLHELFFKIIDEIEPKLAI